MAEKKLLPYWLYFAYGSNMASEQIEARCGHPEVVAVARLADHDVGFFGNSMVWDGALETVVPCPGKAVWGVVYRLSRTDMDVLDIWQDARFDGTGAYFHFPAVVMDGVGNEYEVLLYKKDALGEVRQPSQEYLDLIVRGALARHLPAMAVASLRMVEAKPSAYEVPRRLKYDRSLLAGMSCSDCG